MNNKHRSAAVVLGAVAVLLVALDARAEPQRGWYEENDSVEELGTKLPPPHFDLFCLQGSVGRRLRVRASAHGPLVRSRPDVRFWRLADGEYLAVLPPERCEILAAVVDEIADVLAVEEIVATQQPFHLECDRANQKTRLILRPSAATHVVLGALDVQLSPDGSGYVARSTEQCEAFADVWEVAEALSEQHYPNARFQMFCAHGEKTVRLDVPFTAAASVAKRWPLSFAVSRDPARLPPLGYVVALLPRAERCATFAADVVEIAQALRSIR